MERTEWNKAGLPGGAAGLGGTLHFAHAPSATSVALTSP